MRLDYRTASVTAILIIFLSHRSYSLRCVPCGGEKRCPSETPICIYGLVTDICECCMVCGKGEGEICGGLWNMRGKCGDGLVCVKHQSYPEQAAYPEGKCRSHPTKRPLIVEEDLEGGNGTTTDPLLIDTNVTPPISVEVTTDAIVETTSTSSSAPTTVKLTTEKSSEPKFNLINALTYSQWVRQRLRN